MNWKYYYFKDVHSTNDMAVDYPTGSVLIAETQSAGRGRYGRKWLSEKGNLFLSAVLPSTGNETPLLTFAAAVAVAESLSDFGVNVQIKWPNDILLHDGKLAGILLERIDEKVIIGIGLNLISAPNHDVMYPTSSLNGQIEKKELEQKICEKLGFYANLLFETGFDPIRSKWLNYAIGIGESIRVSLPNETIVGIFEELTPQGAISLKQSDKTHRLITVGDVFFNKMKEKK